MNRLKELPGLTFNTPWADNLSCGIANFRLEGVKPTALGNHLMAQHKIITTPIVHEEFQGLRITPNVYTTLKELDRFCAVVEQVATKGAYRCRKRDITGRLHEELDMKILCVVHFGAIS